MVILAIDPGSRCGFAVRTAMGVTGESTRGESALTEQQLAKIDEVPLVSDVVVLVAEVRRLRADRSEEQKSRRVLARIGCICEPCIEAGPDGEDCWSCALKSELNEIRTNYFATAELLEPLAKQPCESDRYSPGSRDTCQSVEAKLDRMCPPCRAFALVEDAGCRKHAPQPAEGA